MKGVLAMTEPQKDKDQEKGDELLRRLLKTPPDPKTGKGKSADTEDLSHPSEKPNDAPRNRD